MTAQQAKQIVKNALYRTIGETSTTLRLSPNGNRTLRVLMYHKVNDIPDNPTTVEFRFIPMASDTTYVEVSESGFTGTGDEVVRYVADSTSGFTFVLSALKALLEHNIALGLVLDAHPADLEAREEDQASL